MYYFTVFSDTKLKKTLITDGFFAVTNNNNIIKIGNNNIITIINCQYNKKIN